MLNPRLATRYAKSILDLAIERNELETVHADMQYLQALTKGSPEFLALLRSPVVKGDTKKRVVDAVIGQHVSTLTKTFVDLMISKAREATLPEVASAFVEQYKAYKGIHTVALTTAAPISDDTKNRILDQVRATSSIGEIDLQTKVNADLIGGFVLQVGDKLVDASIAYDLRQVKQQFENNDFIYKVR